METQRSETINSTLVADASHYEALRRQHISDLLARMPENVKRVKWPGERIREERQQRLRSLINVAKEKSPRHRDRLRDVDADSFTEADLEKLPVMTKAVACRSMAVKMVRRVPFQCRMMVSKQRRNPVRACGF